jgi:hypothetical protein
MNRKIPRLNQEKEAALAEVVKARAAHSRVAKAFEARPLADGAMVAMLDASKLLWERAHALRLAATALDDALDKERRSEAAEALS